MSVGGNLKVWVVDHGCRIEASEEGRFWCATALMGNPSELNHVGTWVGLNRPGFWSVSLELMYSL